jgi:hypothetical protein
VEAEGNGAAAAEPRNMASARQVKGGMAFRVQSTGWIIRNRPVQLPLTVLYGLTFFAWNSWQR